MEFSHIPVMPEECIQGLAIRSNGIYVDCTLGGGGHSSLILKQLAQGGRLIGIDRDSDAIAFASARLSSVDSQAAFTPVKGNFHDLKNILSDLGISHVDGILADLGVSSYQLDNPERGFSYKEDYPLDMRMDQSSPLTAAMVVNTWKSDELVAALRDYAEEKWAVQIVRVICDRRKEHPIETTGQLVDIIDAAIPAKFRRSDDGHPARRTFQALRIAVNDELRPLRAAIQDMVSVLSPGGRLCIMTFHSLEDRIVKNAMRELENPCTCPRSFPICVCGKKPQVRVVTRKPVTAGDEELKANPRSRSASLRIAEKVSIEA